MTSPRLGFSYNEIVARKICEKVDKLFMETNDAELVKNVIINYLNTLHDEKLQLAVKKELTLCHPHLIDSWVS